MDDFGVNNAGVGSNSNLTDSAMPIFNAAPDAVNAAGKQSKKLQLAKRFGVGLLIMTLLIGGGLVFSNVREQGSQTDDQQAYSVNFDPVEIPLKDLVSVGQLPNTSGQILSVNGQLRANNSLVISPTDQPASPLRGQLYYNGTSNQLAYYNGTEFIGLTKNEVTPAQIAALQNQIQSIQGNIPQIPADVARTTNANVFVALNSFTGGLEAGSLTVSGGASFSSLTTSGNATAGSLNVSGTTSLGSTTISSLLLSSPLAVGSGGTGAATLTQNGVLIGNGTGAISAVTAGAADLCLLSTAGGAPVFDTCPGGAGGGVTSLNGLNGALSLANASGAGSTITINDASTVAKGIVQFNATNFSVAGGVANTIQDIATTSSPTFAGLTVSGTINGQTISATANFTGSVAVTTTLGVTGAANLNGGAVITGGIDNNSGGITEAGSIIGIGANLTGAGALTLQSGGATTLTLDAGGAAALNLGNANANNVLISRAGIQTTVQGSATFNERLTVGNGAGNDYLEFAEEASDPSCAAGDFRVWANSSDGRLKKCQNGTVTDLDASGTGANVSLQDAYAVGNTISTGSARDIAFTLANQATDSNFIVTTATDSTSQTRFILADGAGTTPPSELVLIENQDTNLALANGLTISSAGGVITDGIDLSDSEIVNAINIGTNDILSNGVSISSGELNLLDSHDVALVDTNDAVTTAITGTGALNNGSITSGFGAIDVGNDNITTTGTVTGGTVNGTTDLQTAGTSRIDNSGNLVNIGNLTGTGALTISSTGGSNDIILNSADTIELQDNTNVTGNFTTTGDATIQGGDAILGVASTTSGTLTFRHASNANSGILQIAALGQNTTYTLPDPGGISATICLSTGNCAGAGGGVTGSGTNNRLTKFTSTGSTVGDSTISDDGTTVTTTVDMVVQGGDVTVGTTSQMASLLLHDGNGQTATIRAGDSVGSLTFILPTAAGGTNQCLKQSSTASQLIFDDCDGGGGGSSATLQNAYDNSTSPATITTTDGKNLLVNLADTATDANFLINLQCDTSCGSDGRFAIQDDGTDIFAVTPNGNITVARTIDATGAAGGTALTVAANDIVGTTGDIDFTNFDVTGSNGNVTTTGDFAVNGGDITSTGALNITPGGAMVLGATSQNLTLQGTNATTWTATGGGFTTTVGFSGTPTGAVTYNFDRAATAGSYTVCTTAGNCSGAGVTLQGAYNGDVDGSDAIIALTTADDSIIFRNPASGGTDSAYLLTVDQLATGATGGLNIQSAGTGNLLIVTDTTATARDVLTIADGGAVTFRNQTDSAAAFRIQQAGGTDILTVNSSTPALTVDANTTLAAGRSLIITGSGAFPSSPAEGQVYYRTDTDQLYVHTGSKWQADRSTATKIVAANDSQNKEKADFVADGTGDQTEINAAIQALPANGGRIVLLEGSYSISATITIDRPNVTISGAGLNTNLSKAWDQTSAGSGLITISGNNANISELRIVGNSTTYTNGNNNGIYKNADYEQLTVNSVMVYDFAGDGIYLAGDSDLLSRSHHISNNWIIDNDDDGIQAVFAYHSSFVNNSITGSDSIGLSVAEDSYTNVLSGNLLDGNILGIMAGNNSTVTGNTIQNSGGGALTIDDFTSALNITGNTISTSSEGIIVGSGTSDINISGNQIYDNGDGIVVFGGTTVTRLTISDNNISFNGSEGIDFNNSVTESIISGNNLRNNTGSTSDSSINIDEGTNNRIISNSITDTAGTGFAIRIAAAGTGNYLADNTFSGTGAASISDASSSTKYANQLDGNDKLVSGAAGSIFKNTSDNTTAFQVQKAGAGGSLFTVDSSNDEVELGNSTTAGKLVISDGSSNTATIQTNALAGNYTLSLPTVTGNDTFCLQTLGNCGGGTGDTLQGAYDYGAAGDQVIALDSTQDSLIFRNPASGGSDSTYILTLDQLATGARGGLNIQSAGTGNLLLITDTTATARDVLTIADGGAATFRNQTNSATAFQVQNASGNNLFAVDTSGGKVELGTSSAVTGAAVFRGSGGSGTLTLQGPTTPNTGNYTLSLPAITGNATVCTDNSVCTGYAAASGNGNYIQNQFAAEQTSSNFWISGVGAMDELRVNGSGVNGDSYIRAAANGGFQLQNSNAEPYFVGSHTSTNLLGWSPTFEVNNFGWNAYGSGSGLAVSHHSTLANVYSGRFSLRIITANGTANTGANFGTFTSALTSTTQYTLSFYAKAGGSGFSTLRVGMAYNGVTETPCTLNSTTVSTSGFQRYSCTFTTGTISGSPFIFITTSDTTQNTMYIDDVQLLAGASAQSGVGIGAVHILGSINSPLTIKSNSDSTQAFQIQNAAGNSNLLIADTLNGAVNIGGNLSATGTVSATAFDRSAAGALNIGSSVATSLNIGTASINTTLAASSLALNSGTITTDATSLSLFNTTAATVTGLGAATSTTLGASSGSFNIQNQTLNVGSAGAISVVTAGNAGGTFTTAGYTAASSNSGSATFKSGTVTGATSNSGAVTLKSGDSTTSGNTGNVSITSGNATSGNSGDVTIDVGTASGTLGTVGIGNANASAINIGKTASNITTTITGTTVIKPSSGNDSATAFQVQNAAGASLVNVDSTGSNINILANNAATLSSWTSTTALSVSAGGSTNRARGGAVAANGYLYHVGGNVDTTPITTNNIEYAKIKADGSIDTWVSDSIDDGNGGTDDSRRQTQPVIYNGYMYIVGGRDNSGVAHAETLYAKVSNDGSIGTFQTTASLPAATWSGATIAYNGYIYYIGGHQNTGSPTAQDDLWYARINPDGSVGSWTTQTNVLPVAIACINNSATIANGYVYFAGGCLSGGGQSDEIYYSKIAADGTPGTWATANNMLASSGGDDENYSLFTANGYLYVVGGDYNDRVVAFPLAASGVPGSAQVLTDIGATNGTQGESGGAQYNGYFYLLGGSTTSDGSGTLRSTVLYASTPRVKIGANLDLLSYSGEYMNEGNTGGTLAAGNTNIVGTLKVSDAAHFINNASVAGDLSVGGKVAFVNASDSTTAFQVQNSAGTALLAADTTNMKLTVSGNVELSKRADSGGTTSDWAIASPATTSAKCTSGQANVDSIRAQVIFNGSLYIATGEQDEAELCRYDGGTTFTRINSASGTFGSQVNTDTITAMTVYNGYLYIATTGGTGGAAADSATAAVYRWDGGTTFTLINTTLGQFEATEGETGISTVTAMTVYQGALIIGTSKTNAAEAYNYFGAAPGSSVFTVLNSAAGDFDQDTGIDRVTSFAVYDGRLYMGIAEANLAQILYYEGDYHGFDNFSQNNATGGNVGPITGVDEVTNLTVYNGALMFATADAATDTARIWRLQETYGASFYAQQVNVTGTFGSQANTDFVKSMAVYNGSLYVATTGGGGGTGADATGAGVYRYTDANTFALTNSAVGTFASTTGIDNVTTMIPFNDRLFIGTSESNSAEVYSYSRIEGQSRALVFNASSDNGGTEQSAYPNQGSIFFAAESQAANNLQASATGNFIFSHSMQTSTGAYDVAEDYPTRDDSLQPGDLVSIDPHETGFVRKAKGPNDLGVVGIYSEKPALRLSQKDSTINGGRAVPIALAGRVPAKVSAENGPILPGDPLTASSVPGVAMKATKAGRVVGMAMAGFSGEGTGSVMTFVNPNFYSGNGNVQGGSQTSDLVIEGILTTKDLNVTGVASVNELKVTGFATIANLTVTGKATINELAVSGTAVVGELHVLGHFTTKGKALVAVALPAAGTGAEVIVEGNDVSGKITIKTGSVPLDAGDLAKLTFNTAYTKAPNVIISPSGPLAAKLQAYRTGFTEKEFSLGATNPPEPGKVYVFEYFITEAQTIVGQ